jgi:hypothetical protein
MTEWLINICSTQTERSLPSLKQLLQGACTDDEMMQFQKFLQREFCIENLLFWRAVRNFHSLFPKQQTDDLAEETTALETAALVDKTPSQNSIPLNVSRLERAKRIYQRYLAKGAPYQVNLESELVSSIEKTLEDLSTTLTESKATFVKSESHDLAGSSSTTAIITIDMPPVTTPLQTVFDEAQTQIYLLLKNDTFPRFRDSFQSIAHLP